MIRFGLSINEWSPFSNFSPPEGVQVALLVVVPAHDSGVTFGERENDGVRAMRKVTQRMKWSGWVHVFYVS